MSRPRYAAFVVFRTLNGIEVRNTKGRRHFEDQDQFFRWAADAMRQGETVLGVFPGSEDLVGATTSFTVRPRQVVLATSQLDPGQLLYSWMQGVHPDRLFFVCDNEAVRSLRLAARYRHLWRTSPGAVHKLFDDVRNHRLYDRASFIRHLGLAGLLHFVCTVVDPRIFLRQHRPVRAVNKLLGVFYPDVAVQRGIEDIMPVWIDQLRDLSTKAMSLPGMFPARIYNSHEELLGLVRATQAVVRFLYWNWLDAVYGRKGEFFLPDDFFKYPGEAEAFWEHVDHCRY